MPIYSHSKLETFENCALRYKFKYIDRIEKPEEQTVEAFVGNRVHETLRKLYDDLRAGVRNSLEGLVAHFRAGWKERWGPGIKIVRAGTDEQEYRDYGERCVRNYYSQYAPFTQSETLSTEERFVMDLDKSKEIQLQGYMDRVARRADGTYEIHDYKTGRHLPTQSQADGDRQLGLYQMALEAQRPDARRVELLWHFLGHGRTVRSFRRAPQLVQLRQATTQLIERIERQKEFAPRQSRLCDWCEYKPECPVWTMKTTVPGEKAGAAGRPAAQSLRAAGRRSSAKKAFDSLGKGE